MKLIHRVLCILLFLTVTFICYILKAKLTEALSQNLVTFFSISFGFFTTAIAIIFNSAYLKQLYAQITPSGDKREIHIFSHYLKLSAYWSIGSIVIILAYMMFASKAGIDGNTLVLNLGQYILRGVAINLDCLASAVIFGISSVNIFMMALVFNSLLYGLVLQANDTND